MDTVITWLNATIKSNTFVFTFRVWYKSLGVIVVAWWGILLFFEFENLDTYSSKDLLIGAGTMLAWVAGLFFITLPVFLLFLTLVHFINKLEWKSGEKKLLIQGIFFILSFIFLYFIDNEPEWDAIIPVLILINAVPGMFVFKTALEANELKKINPKEDILDENWLNEE